MAKLERHTLVRDENAYTSEAWRNVPRVVITRNGCVVERVAVGMVGGVHKFRFNGEQDARDAVRTMVELRTKDGYIKEL